MNMIDNLKRYKFDIVTINLSTSNHYSNPTLTLNRVEKETDYFEVELANNIKLDMVNIPQGNFIMVTPDTE